MDASRVTGHEPPRSAVRTPERSPYVLVTPARNEEAYIEETIRSVLDQNLRPSRWVIVSDGSTDRTDEIVRHYATHHQFITLVRAESTGERNFASKILAFRRGYKELRDIPHEFVGNLDADVTIPPEYFSRTLERFNRNPRLGICSAVYWYRSGSRILRSRNRRDGTAGSLQLFRRECYEEIDGFVLLEVGGEDTVAACMARMAGWETRSFDEPRAIVRRPSGAFEGSGRLRSRFAQGATNYEWGAHPLFMIAKAVTRVPEPPYLFGSVALLGGYVHRWLRHPARNVPDTVVRFIQREQLERLRLALRPSAWRARGDSEWETRNHV